MPVGVVEEDVTVAASLADAWDAYFEPRMWPSWVDSFGSVTALDGYPQVGGTLRWKSVPAGRGEVTETVLEHEPRRLHRIRFTDPSLQGEMSVSFAIEGEGTKVKAVFEYRVVDPSLFARAAALIFVKPQIRGTLRRSLDAFANDGRGIKAGRSPLAVD